MSQGIDAMLVEQLHKIFHRPVDDDDKFGPNHFRNYFLICSLNNCSDRPIKGILEVKLHELIQSDNTARQNTWKLRKLNLNALMEWTK